jgi:long-chain acyl-CoA synthetase
MSGQLAETGNLTDDIVVNAHDHPEAVAFRRRSTDTGTDGWVEVTTSAFLDEVRAVARGFVAAGLQPGDRVALISKTRYEWTVLDYAIWTAGLISVPVYETSSAEQIAWILSDSAARAVLTETKEHASRVSQVRDGLTELHHVWSIDEGGLAALATLGEDIDLVELEQRRGSLTPESPATLIYTSGTTGRPKGCLLTHGNFMYEVGAAVDELDRLFSPGEDADSGSSTLLFLPLAHVFARIIQIGCVRARVQMGHAADIRTLLEDFESFRPTFILAVPRVFEKVFNTASQRAVADGKGRAFQRAADVAIAWSRAQDERGPGPLLRAQHAIFDRLVYRKLRAALGGQCQYAVSGGAPLGERLGHFYRGIGVTILEGYGLTETTAALTVNLPDAQKVGTVGRPLAGTAVRVADDGELLFRGGQVFCEYWNNPEATASAKDSEGWFHTGDIGEIDSDGFVRITGRKKEILVTAGGKNVAPAVLEDRMRAHALVDQVMVVGDGQPFVAALVTIDEEAFESWLSRTGKSGSIADHANDPDLLAEIQVAVDDANSAVSKAESVRKFVVLPTAWTEEGGELTASLKLKRNVVMRECADDVERLYSH